MKTLSQTVCAIMIVACLILLVTVMVAADDGTETAYGQCTDFDDDGYGAPGFPADTCELDNCPGIYNPDQVDSDGNGLGDACGSNNAQSRITIIPPNPTATDSVRISIEHWLGTPCWESQPTTFTTDGNLFTIQHNVYVPPGICIDLLVPWGTTRMVGPLKPGIYGVQWVRYVSYFGGSLSPFFSSETFEVTRAPGTNLTTSKSSMDFTFTDGLESPAPQSFLVDEMNGDNVSFDVSEDCEWLSVDISDGVTPEYVSVSVDGAGMEIGDYRDSVVISSGQADNSPVIVYVNMAVFSCTLKRVSVDQPAACLGQNTIPAGVPVDIPIRFSNLNCEGTRFATSNAWRIYSPDGASWSGTELVKPVLWQYEEAPGDTVDVTLDDLFEVRYPLATLGDHEDSVGYIGTVTPADSGLFDGFDYACLGVRITASEESIGSTICIDTATIPHGPIYEWEWDHDLISIVPAWTGPHCFEIVGCDDPDSDLLCSPCDNCPDLYNPEQADMDGDGVGDVCDPDVDGDGHDDGNDNCPLVANADQADNNSDNIGNACCCGIYTEGFTGNANCSSDGKITLADITALIDIVYISKPAPCCPYNANVNGSTDGLVTLADITRLIDYVYISKQPTAACD